MTAISFDFHSNILIAAFYCIMLISNNWNYNLYAYKFILI